MSDADRIKALEAEVDLLRRDSNETLTALAALRAELEQARVIAVPNRTAEMPTVAEVPIGHGRGQCDACGGFHPVDGAPEVGH